MVIAVAVAKLIVVLPYPFAYKVRLTEIERRALDGKNLPCGDALFVDGDERGSVDAHFIVLDPAVAFTAEAEERMVGHIDRRGLVRDGGEVQTQGIVPGDGIYQGKIEIAGIAFEHIGVAQLQDNR